MENYDEKSLKEVLRKSVLSGGVITFHTKTQLIDYIFNGAPFEAFDDKSREELSGFYDRIKTGYYDLTGEFIVNIFGI